MGYYTYYNIEAYENTASISEEREKEICKFMRENESFDYFYQANAERFYDFFYESIKWYDHDEDMIEISKAFPTVTFVLYGEGEERDDNWIAYYKNGEMEQVNGTIVYEDPVTAFARSVAWR